MANFQEIYKARDIITDILRKDLVGPVTNDEVLAELPTSYYIMGKLYPQSGIEGSEEEALNLDLNKNPLLENKIDEYDSSLSLSNVRNPSSMGVTCALDGITSEIVVSGKFAFYIPIPLELATKNGIDKAKIDGLSDKTRELWKRQEYSFSHNILIDKSNSVKIVLANGMELRVYIHNNACSNDIIATIVLINTNKTDNNKENIAEYTAFQSSISVSSNDGRDVFKNVNQQLYLSNDDEITTMDMLYNDVLCYGQGHGCSVTWNNEDKKGMVINSSWFPTYELLQMMPIKLPNCSALSMKFLSTANCEDVINELLLFISKYQDWINDQHKKIKNLPSAFHEAAVNNMNLCQKSHDIIVRSIKMIADAYAHGDKLILQAFQMANEAMLMQRKQTILKNGNSVDENQITWYPFQLAFILQELPSFIDPNDETRDSVDLLWFPTGGGKTEAYLGISAFVIFLRRLRNPLDNGVTVLMRYTLRLLTIQQFERASSLICACELLRIKYGLGGERISIGLWVGGNLTPNDINKAQSQLNNLKNGIPIDTNQGDPCQMKVCPWCGTRLDASNYSIDKRTKELKIVCSNEKCDFNTIDNSLPLHLIDESIYVHTPDFLVATIDKFAQIPLSDKPAAIFGITTQKKPIELIIQDELHLISGPLGTITGIYEAIINKLCERDGIKAKIIASTATIRNASSQILALYGRKHTQFPPQGLTAKDSFFAIQSTRESRPARQYCGVLGVGTTATTTLIRVNAALLFATRYLATLGFEDSVVDNFWTIVGYFNSLRELGGASTQLLDDVQSRFQYLADTKFHSYKLPANFVRPYTYNIELTSRMNNDTINDVIQNKLKIKYSSTGNTLPYDYVMASNMISVGVDVSRLGCMTVVGQPKTNAEYIQATSRVGRENPGLVISVYNQSRSRDRSHYEQFVKYHSAMYRYVEATSLTPFADRARDRGLHALYVALYRYLIKDSLDNTAAKSFNTDNALIIEGMIKDYIRLVDPKELLAAEEELEYIREEWLNSINTNNRLVYKDNSYSGSGNGLLKKDTVGSRFSTMNSMRNVDAQTGIYLLR